MKEKKPRITRTKQHSAHKAKIINDLKIAIEEMHLVKEGKLIARNAEDLFNEL